jgi:CRP/FNR family transcriptional regulator, cyclic AMP receptor protein
MSTQTPSRLTRVLDIHPDLGGDLDDKAFAEAQRMLVAPAVELAPGPWEPTALTHVPALRGRPLGCLLARGVVVREVVLANRVSTTLYGPRDILAVIDGSDVSLPLTYRHSAAVPSEVVVLDDRFLVAARHWPRLVGRLMDAMADQVARGCAHQAISQLPRVEDRLVALFWHLADRWGHVGPDGVSVDLPLTHEALGRLVGARRPTVSLGLQTLAERGLLTRPDGGRWLLAARSIEALAVDAATAQRLGSVLGGRTGTAAASRVAEPERRELSQRLLAMHDEFRRMERRTAETLARTQELREQIAARRAGDRTRAG